MEAADGHRWQLYVCAPAEPVATLLWLPALGVGARHYLPFARALAARGVATFLHEWRGAGSSSLRAGRDCDWGYRELLELDIPTSADAVRRTCPGIPAFLGGHSLGGQLACCRLALDPDAARQLWLVASGAPYWRAFPLPHRLWLPMAYRFLPWLAERNGALPGRRLGFGGREARGVMRDWARSALTGRYAAAGLDTDLEAGMAAVRSPVRAVTFQRDWLAPPSSLRHLVSKLPDAGTDTTSFDDGSLGARADHFQWMRAPGPVAEWLTR
ncbi:MAG: hypothetical protein GX805_04175 [Gammaproteobacteria bacterium]|nr:hypothetical protein [Gammaproteobacteria bacterium]